MKSEPPFKPGDRVTTDFYKKQKKLIRTVVDVYDPAPVKTDSGWYVDAVDREGTHINCDAGWFTLVPEPD